jgi:hypothetical protein
MKQMTQRAIKATNATDITASERIKGLHIIAKSYGVYGMNGALLEDNAGNLYKITCRNSNLFMYN